MAETKRQKMRLVQEKSVAETETENQKQLVPNLVLYMYCAARRETLWVSTAEARMRVNIIAGKPKPISAMAGGFSC